MATQILLTDIHDIKIDRSGPAKKILIVDDDDHVVKLFSILLENSKNSVFYSNRPEDAIEMIGKQNFDRVIVDYRFDNSEMTGSNILEIAEKNGIEERILITSVSPLTNLKGTHAVLGVRKPLTRRVLLEICQTDMDKINLHSFI